MIVSRLRRVACIGLLSGAMALGSLATAYAAPAGHNAGPLIDGHPRCHHEDGSGLKDKLEDLLDLDRC